MSTTKRLALLVTDTPLPSVVERFGAYPEIFHELLVKSSKDLDVSFTLDSYDILSHQYPTPAQEDQYDGMIITGSAASAYADVKWIHKLVAYIARLGKEKPQIKIIGVCFGHQIVGMAFGSVCVRNEAGWEAGVTPITLTDLGKQVFSVPDLNIEQMHRDHVPSLPPSFHLLASTNVCYNQGMVRYTNGAEPSSNLADVQVITVQGHPEFTNDINSLIVDAREAGGVIDSTVANGARARGGLRNDGPGPIMAAVWKVLGVPAKNNDI